MRPTLVALALAPGLVLLGGAPADSCGDKLLLLGRGIRFQSRHTPRAASVLLYLPASQSGARQTDPKLESALREAGHKLRTAVTREELTQAIAVGHYDVVAADVTDATSVSDAIRSSAGPPIVLPVVYLLAPLGQPQPKLDVESTKKSYGVVLRVPGRAGHYCSAVDKALSLKLQRERSK